MKPSVDSSGEPAASAATPGGPTAARAVAGSPPGPRTRRRRWLPSGLRGRLLLVGAIAAVAAAGVIRWQATARYRAAEADVGSDTLHLTELAAHQLERLVEGERHLLLALAAVPAIRDLDAPASSALLAAIKRELPLHANLAAFKADGEAFASGIPLGHPVNSADLPWFRRAVRTRGFAVGEFQVGRISGRQVLVAAYPVLDDAGEVRAVVNAALDLTSMNTIIKPARLPPGAVMVVVDRQGTVLARQPDASRWVGHNVAEAASVKALLSRRRGTAEVTGLDGVTRIHSFAPVAGADDSMTVSIGIPRHAALAGVRRALVKEALGVGLVGVGVALIVVLLLEVSVLRPVRVLVAWAGRLAGGDLGAHTGPPYGAGELEQLRQVLDGLAAALERREAERARVADRLERSNRHLRVINRCREALVRATDEAELLQAICSIAVEQGGYSMAWVGLAEDDAAKTVRPAAQAGFEAGYLDTVNITWADAERGRGPTGTAIRTGAPCLARNIPDDPAFGPWRAAAIQRGYSSAIALPLTAGGETLGALVLYSAMPDAFDADEMALLVELAGDLAQGLDALRTRNARARAEAALGRSEERFRRLAENARDMIYRMLLPEGRYEYVSPAATAVFGYTPEEFYASPLLIREAIHPDWRDFFEREWRKLLCGDAPPSWEYQIVHKSGAVRWLNQRNIVVRGADGRPDAIEGIVTDVTARKRAEGVTEARLRLLELATSRSLDELLTATLDEVEALTGSRIGFFHFLGADQRTLALHAWSTRTCREFCSAEGQGRHYDLDEAGVWADCVRERRHVVHNDYATLPHRRGLPAGHAAVTRELVVPIFRASRIVAVLGVGNKPSDYCAEDVGLVSHFADLAWDIAERQQAEEQVRRLNAELEQRVLDRTAQLTARNEELKTFAYTVSHDLKAPLRGISGYAQELELRHQDGLAERARFCIAQIITASRNLDHLIEDLLAYSRLGAETPTPTEVRLADLVQRIVRDRGPTVTGLGAEVTVRIPPLTLHVWERGLHQLLANLVDNAVKYSRRSTPPRVTITAETRPGAVRVAVADNGIGFDMKYHDRIFGLFNRLVRAEEFEGTGVGLAIVAKLAAKLGGTVRAESAPGRGATFFVELPRQAELDA